MMDTKSPHVPVGAGVLPCFTVDEFCTANRISRSTYYSLKRLGRGPREMHVNGRVLVSPEANADWRLECEKSARCEPTESAA